MHKGITDLDRRAAAAGPDEAPQDALLLPLLVKRAPDWLGQAGYDLQRARNSRVAGGFSWACFAAHQPAEKAVKAVYLSLNLEGWGRVVRALLQELAGELPVPEGVVESGRRLDLFYTPTQYPNSFPQGKPADFFGASDADRAITDAEKILGFCQDRVGP